jgi:ElaB/YqjD/DUF883 family membrane-anchored ribosome-binding protein
MADDAQEAVRDAADQASDKVREFGDKAGETFRKASDKVNQSAKDGLKTARQFAQTAQKYVEDSGIGDVDVREIVTASHGLRSASRLPRALWSLKSCGGCPSRGS